jgi:hypothetical protein
MRELIITSWSSLDEDKKCKVKLKVHLKQELDLGNIPGWTYELIKITCETQLKDWCMFQS